MTELKPIDKAFLQRFFAELETEAHAIHALVSGLPKENFFLARYYDNQKEADGWPDEEEDIYSVREFFDRFDAFHPEDDFGIYFAAHSDRIDSDQADEYTDHIWIDEQDEATVADMRKQLSHFLEPYCEKCLRDNRPFELTPEIIARFGFTPEDVAWLDERVNRHNAAAKRLVRAEYDALSRLDFLRNDKK